MSTFATIVVALLTLAAIVASEAGIALAMSHQAFSFSAAAVRAIVGHVVGNGGHERDFLGVSVVVVQRQEPLALFHVIRSFLLHRRLRPSQ